MSGVTHTAGATTVTVPADGSYQINYGISITAGLGSSIVIEVNGTPDPSTQISALVTTGELSGTATLTLATGDSLTLVNNSAVGLTLSLAPNVGAQFDIIFLS
nr:MULTISPECIES: hypothetical protein [Acutalibacteraceae]